MLGVPSTASEADIAKAYHALAARYHPDKHQGNVLEDLARDKLIELNQAYAVLKDPRLRAEYDAARRGVFPSGRPGTGAPRYQPRSVSSALRSLLLVIVLLAAIPLVLRFIRSPRVLAVIAIAVFLAWFGPRIYRYFKKK